MSQPEPDLDDTVASTVIVPTGHAEVDEVVAQLQALDGTAPAEHPPVFDRVHQGLRAVLDATTAG